MFALNVAGFEGVDGKVIMVGKAQLYQKTSSWKDVMVRL